MKSGCAGTGRSSNPTLVFFRSSLSVALSAASIIFVSACGGGDSISVPVSSPTPIPDPCEGIIVNNTLPGGAIVSGSFSVGEQGTVLGDLNPEENNFKSLLLTPDGALASPEDPDATLFFFSADTYKLIVPPGDDIVVQIDYLSGDYDPFLFVFEVPPEGVDVTNPVLANDDIDFEGGNVNSRIVTTGVLNENTCYIISAEAFLSAAFLDPFTEELVPFSDAPAGNYSLSVSISAVPDPMETTDPEDPDRDDEDKQRR